MGNEFEHHDYYDEHPLDFEKIESGELFLDAFARNRIHRLYLEFRSAAEMYNSAPPLDAMAARSKARTINKKATAAKKALSELSVCAFDAVLHDFNLFEAEEGNAYLFKVKRAIRLVRKIEQEALSRSIEVHRGGRPEFWDFKRLVVELYRVFLASGGEGRIIWDKNRKCYKGYPIFFIRRVVDQIKPLIPEAVLKSFLPSTDSAVSRTAAEAIRDFENEEAKNPPKRRSKSPYFCLPSH